ncbi:MAG: type 4a pilus biogenesis protein PilO [Pseudomonadales bacterium]|nr:type 4a pilus biogenesis protein PilO [Pseudomonadales bacterium]
MAFESTIRELRSFDWNNLGDIQSIGVWPGPVKFVLAAVTMLAVLGAGYWFDIKNLQSQLQVLQAEEQRLRAEYTQKAFMAANLEAYREQIETMETAFSDLLRQLPSQTEVPDLVDDVTATGLGSGLSFARIELDQEIVQEFYIEQPIQLEVLGSYHDFGTFVSGVASLPRIVTLHDFDIDAGADRSVLEMTITAKTYRYRNEQELTETAGGGNDQ